MEAEAEAEYRGMDTVTDINEDAKLNLDNCVNLEEEEEKEE